MTDHYTEAHNALDDLLNVDDDAPHSKGRRDTLANVQVHALLALTDAVREAMHLNHDEQSEQTATLHDIRDAVRDLAPKDATDARHEREDTEARQDDLPNYGLYVAERDRADVGERMVEQLGDEVKRLNADLDHWMSVAGHRLERMAALDGALARTRVDADGDALVTVRADDLRWAVSLTRGLLPNPPKDRLRRALDERGSDE